MKQHKKIILEIVIETDRDFREGLEDRKDEFTLNLFRMLRSFTGLELTEFELKGLDLVAADSEKIDGLRQTVFGEGSET